MTQQDGDDARAGLRPFAGQVLCRTACHLGEGPVQDPGGGRLFWVDILERRLFELPAGEETARQHALPFMASFVALVDERTQLLGCETGLVLRDTTTGGLTPLVQIEADRAGMRSNDGRVHPSGAVWIGTMRKAPAEPSGGGTIYHVAGTRVTPLFRDLGVPNGICFSPDGATGYFADLRRNLYMRVALDPATGLPRGAPEVFIDTRHMAGGIDGSVCDSEGCIWNARAGSGEVQRYSPAGQLLERHRLPAGIVTCPAFAGLAFDRLIVTSAHEGLDAAGRRADPAAGQTFDLGLRVPGRSEPAFRPARARG